MSEPPGQLITPTPRHLSQMVALHAATLAWHHRTHPAIFRPEAPDRAMHKHFRRYLAFWPRLRRQTRWALGWEVEGLLRAYVLFTAGVIRETPLHHGRLAFHVNDIAVHPDFHGHGLARRLLAEVKARAADSPARGEVHVEVWHGNAVSERLFQAAGFRPLFQRFACGLEDADGA